MAPSTIGTLSSRTPLERRVALVPATTGALAERGLRLVVETGAGAKAGYADDAYREQGAIIASRDEVRDQADVLLTVEHPAEDDIAALRAQQSVIGFLDPLGDADATRRLAATGAALFALELVPRTTRAQAMDALSSQATIAGYHAVLLAAERSPRLFPMLTTAAGTIKARHVLVLGAGVAGLQAIATARRLGAVVTAFDVRAAAREQVESLGARFLALEISGDEQAGGYATELAADQHRLEQEALAAACAQADVVIATAQIPGARAPELITDAALAGMQPGSIVVDLAAATGGNCSRTQPDVVVEVGGVTVLGPTHPASAMPATASDLLSANFRSLLGLLAPADAFDPDWDDDIVSGTLVARGGEIANERVRGILEGGS